MRLSFVNGEHADVILGRGSMRLGSAGGNDLVLDRADVKPAHARLTLDARGIVLDVLDPAARTHVNARPVRENALLHYGDFLSLGAVVIVLKPDTDDAIRTDVPEAPAIVPAVDPPRAVLRGVSGDHFGQAIAVAGRLVIGCDPACDLVIDAAHIASHHAMLDSIGDALYLHGTTAANLTYVDGVKVKDAIVQAGDQLVFEGNHFIVEAPGLPARVELPHMGQPGDDEDMLRDERSAQARAIWWLLGAAALIALGLVLLIHRGI